MLKNIPLQPIIRKRGLSARSTPAATLKILEDLITLRSHSAAVKVRYLPKQNLDALVTSKAGAPSVIKRIASVPPIKIHQVITFQVYNETMNLLHLSVRFWRLASNKTSTRSNVLHTKKIYTAFFARNYKTQIIACLIITNPAGSELKSPIVHQVLGTGQAKAFFQHFSSI